METPDERQNEQRLRDLAEQVADTQDSLAVTFQAMAERADREGRPDDARRLRDEAAAARTGAEREHRMAARRPPVPEPRESDRARAEDRLAAAQRARETAAVRRDMAAHLRDEVARERDAAARMRDEAATRRDAQAVDRAVAEGRRDSAAEANAVAERTWGARRAAPDGDMSSEARAEQREIDEEVGVTYRRLSESNRRRVLSDRAATVSDRGEAERNRVAAAEDREAARIDRVEAARDRAAAEADREQAEIDVETRP